MFLSSPKAVTRFAAVKTLNRVMLTYCNYDITLIQISTIHPDVVTTCNVDLENLISDNNRSIATLAITTLLKVCIYLVWADSYTSRLGMRLVLIA